MTAESELMREQHGPIMERQSQSKFPAPFGNYVLRDLIDSGGMGDVFLAEQLTAFKRQVAIKIIRSDLVHDITARARFLREAEVSAHLKHEHILPLFDFGEVQGRLFLVTPYIEGGTLERRLQSGPLSLAEVHRLFVPLVQAVAYVHRRGVIHRDLKPTNILLDQEDGQVYVRLIDFGIASLQGSTASPPLTTAGTELGTVAYMAPERLSGIAAPSNDIYSLGIILYQLLTGQLPSVEHRVRLPQPLEYVIHHCIAPNVEDRFASAEELLKAFEHAYQQLVASSQAATVPPVAAPIVDDRAFSPISQNSTSRKIPDDISDPEESGTTPKRAAVIPAILRPPVQAQAQGQSGFVRADYAAPTTSIDSLETAQKQLAAAPPPPPITPPLRKKRKRSLMAITSLLIVLLLLAIGGLTYFEFQTITVSAVSVQFGPQTHLINQVFQITAKPTVSTLDVNTRSMAAKVLSTTKSDTQTGPTTGQTNCVFGIFGCQQSVDVSDVSNLATQIRPGLVSQINQDLEKQIANIGAHAVGSIHTADLSEVADPQVGTPSKTVAVTLKVQGSIEYIVNADAESLARQLLTKQVQALGPDYVLLNPTMRIGQPVIEAVDDTTGNVTIKIAAGGVAEYVFPSAQLQGLGGLLKGKTVNAATALLAQQPGIDKSTIAIHFTSGKGPTLPNDVQHIRVIPLTPTSLPTVNLQAVPTSVSNTSP